MPLSDIIDCRDIYGSVIAIARQLIVQQGGMLVFNGAHNQVQFILKIMTVHIYPMMGVINDVDYISSTKCQIRVGYLLRERLIRKGRTPCLMELLSHVECEDALDQVDSYSAHSHTEYHGNERLIRLFLVNARDEARAGFSANTVTLAAFEYCGASLRAYLAIGSLIPMEQFVETVRGFVWMIAFTLYTIRREFPGFEHHDLHLENVLVKTDDSYNAAERGSIMSYLEFSRDADTKYYVPYFGVYPKIIDYGNCTVPSEGFGSVVMVGDKGVVQKTNDMQNFLWYLYADLSSVYNSTTERYAALDALLTQLDTQRYFSRLAKEHTELTPEQVIDHPIYADYRVAKPGKHVYSRYGYK